jgi:Restriction endonuclease
VRPIHWASYEELVEHVCRELGAARGIKVYSKREYLSTSGRPIEVDVSFELEALGARIFGIVECKHYSRRVEAAEVMILARTVEQLRAHKGILVSTVGFQSGALQEAAQAGVALATLEPKEAGASLDYVLRRKRYGPGGGLQGRVSLPAAGGTDFPFSSGAELVALLRQFEGFPRGTRL